MMQSKQKGFTLLELLVVITLLAVLSVGALIAYEGIGDNAQATAAANNTAGVDRAIRNFRAVSLTYPNQWDNLVQEGSALSLDGLTEVQALAAEAAKTPLVVARPTRNAFGSWNIAADAQTKSNVMAAFDAVGIDEVQQVTALEPGKAPNVQHNEGANPAAHQREFVDPAFTHVSIMPSSVGATACSAGAVAASIGTNFAGDAPVAVTNDYGLKLNAINDSLDPALCQLVIALGFGHDAAHSTANSPAAIVTAATYSSKAINPANSYGRYVALFHVGTGNATTITSADIHKKAHLIAIVDTEGNSIDTNIANATATN
ncbi:MAG: type II secretion system protein [Methylotenera sp.]|nr:type II secretion system protein [Methylotenera sp.]